MSPMTSSPKLASLIEGLKKKLTPSSKFLLYGAYGYSATLVLKLIKEYELLQYVYLAGRSRQKINKLLQELKIEEGQVAGIKVFGLENDFENQLAGISVVLNCAGPYPRTAMPFINTCARCGVSYLDISGDMNQFERVLNVDDKETQKLHKLVNSKQVSIIPAVGFDVVPSDCLAMKAARMYDEKYLKKGDSGSLRHKVQIAIKSSALTSKGTLKSVVGGLQDGFRARRDHKITSSALGSMFKKFKFSNNQELDCTSFSWGDIGTAYYSTSFTPNIETYIHGIGMPKVVRFLMQVLMIHWFLTLLYKIPFVLLFIEKLVESLGSKKGPTEKELESTKEEIAVVVSNAKGDKQVSLSLVTRSAYRLTSECALVATLKVLVGEAKPGCLTPSQALGEDFILQFDDTKVYEL